MIEGPTETVQCTVGGHGVKEVDRFLLLPTPRCPESPDLGSSPQLEG